MSLKTFTAGYIQCALWSSVGDDDEPLDSGEHELAGETRAKMERDCAKFHTKFEKIVEASEYSWAQVPDDEHAGHDFWLTRCGHGAGFWDGDWPEDLGKRLTSLCKEFGNVDLYIGDDDQIYGSP